MTAHRPGDVLAGRYRLADLLSETAHGRFWLAHDSVLGRPVAVHVIDADDSRAPALMDAARASASILDPRLLRVLDAETRDGSSYVVNEWGRGTSLDIVLARSGPLSPRRSAWITAEVAAALGKAHGAGHAHGRLNPEKVLIDEGGSVRIIGFAVEAALYGFPAGTPADDDAALAAILAACLTGTWSGFHESAVPPTPSVGGHPMRPRQVRAGVPRVLDELCEAALNPDARGRHQGPVLDARYLHQRLMEYLGDPSDVVGLPAEQPDGAARPRITTSLRLPVEEPAAAPGSPDEPAERHEDETVVRGDHTDIPTQASLPPFEDDSSWHLPRTTPAPPPPPLEPPAPKPLFADEPRVPRPPEGAAGDTPSSVPVSSGGHAAPAPVAEEYWPWGEDRVPPRRRRWLPLAIGLVVLVLVVAAVLAVRDLSGGGGGDGTPSTSPSASASSRAAQAVTGVTATDFDPLGDPPSEYPALARNAVDGKVSTAWHTNTYKSQLGPSAPALKSGVGLVLDLHGTYALESVKVTMNGSPTAVSFFVADAEPTGVTGLQRAATATVTRAGQRVGLNGATGRYLVVWLTSLPHVAGGYRGEVAEVAVTGTQR
ncbi:protein kinase family protein [Nocardioides sp. BP30]|uniref:protein kinase family protein n=1 Tax=Nocardioides sp. BP30 TaxID=3036374 RepID=UPI00246911BD|nr:protein kinase family protein [Nocardioides sp. BP30]WGL52540.1 protein kinase family protein [Nocardioides sp. BP30]